MGSKLIIVESFTKTKTISKYLNCEYKVICSLGHICDLPKKSLGIDTTTWEGVYENTNAKIIKNIIDCVREADIIYIASDPDIEGEAIAYHIKRSINNLLKNKTCYRVRFNEITKTSIINALQNPSSINYDIVAAQETRRFLDRLVGFGLSPLLWKKFTNYTLSVGRVQSIALLMSIDSLENIKKHVLTQYWNINGRFNAIPFGEILSFKLYLNDKLFKIDTEDDVITLLDSFDLNTKYKCLLNEKKSSESPSPPYTTTSLQQDAYNKFKFNTKKTMKIAQELYENGYITYMRTDSNNISDEFKKKIIEYISKTYDGNAKFRNYKNKISNAQEAHEAIRITDIDKTSINLSEDNNKLYRIIWERTIASQMCNAEYINIEISLIPQLSNPNLNLSFINTKSFLVNQGYLHIYNKSDDNDILKKFKNKIEDMNVSNFIPLEYYTNVDVNHPPSLYNEIGLIKSLEKEGIGRPSTYSSIVEKLYSKNYIEKGSNPTQIIKAKNIIKKKSIKYSDVEINVGGNKKDLIVPTQLGIEIIEYLKSIIPFLLDIKFTSKMEETLENIISKQNTKINILKDFYYNHLKPVIDNDTVVSSVTAPVVSKSGIIKSKYGYCYFHSSEKRYTNIESYLKWKNKTAKNLTKIEIDFLKSLPKKLDNGNKELHIGQYGLYIKENGANISLSKDLWNSYIGM